MGNIKIGQKDLRDVLIYSFRYTLGRATYSVSTVATIIKNNSTNLSTPDLGLYIREINQAIEDEMCGMEMDCLVWKHLAEWLQLELNRREA